MNVQVHRIDPTLPLPQCQTDGSCAFDFVARKNTVVPPRGVALVPGNLIVAVPEGCALLVMPRSSLFRKKSLLIPNSPGLIDRDYCGEHDEICIQVLNLSDEPVTVDRGERIAQGMITRIETATWEEVDRPDGGSRGGFGSTGEK